MLKKFVRREKIYLLMLIFIVLFNLAVSSLPSSREADLASKQVLSERIQEQELLEIISQNESLRQKLMIVSLFFLLILIAGIALLIRIIWLRLRHKQIIEKFKGVSVYVKWQIGDIVRVVILIFFWGYLISVFSQLLFQPFLANLCPNLKMAINACLVDFLLLFFVCYFVFKKYKQKFVSLGISLKTFSKKIKLGIVSYIAIVPVLVAMLAFLSNLATRLNYQPPAHPLIDIIFTEKSVPFLIFLFLLGGIIGPIVEEIFFRGFAYPAIKNKTGAMFATIITATFFAALHQNLFAFLPIFFLGAVLAYVYEKSGSLIPSVTIHILHNSLMISGILLVKGIL